MIHFHLFLVFSAIFALGILQHPAKADVPTYELGGALVTTTNPSAWGGEFVLSRNFEPLRDRWVDLSPLLGVSSVFGNNASRFDFFIGPRGRVWLMNALAPGLSVQAVTPIHDGYQEAKVRFKVEPEFSVRVAHFGDTGAWAIRVSVPYDTQYHWGFCLGLSIQLHGVTD